MPFVDDRRIETALDFSDPSFGTARPLRGMIERVGLSRDYNSRVVQAALGVRPSLLDISVRLGQAHRELMFSDTPIIQVSQQAGFSFQSAFSRAFKDFFGVTPRTVRRHGRECGRRPRNTAAGPNLRVVPMNEVGVFRRIYLCHDGGSSSLFGSQTEIECVRQLIRQVATGDRAIEVYSSGFYLPDGCAANRICNIAITPDAAGLCPLLKRHFADAGVYTTLVQGGDYLALGGERGAPSSCNALKDTVAHWVRNQKTHRIAAGAWIERTRFARGGVADVDVLVPLDSR